MELLVKKSLYRLFVEIIKITDNSVKNTTTGLFEHQRVIVYNQGEKQQSEVNKKYIILFS